jgi:hypothetical protein
MGREIKPASKTPQLTPQREAVLRAVRERMDHPTANEIFVSARAILPTISYATVYNSLRYLREEGLVREISFGDSASRYDGHNLAQIPIDGSSKLRMRAIPVLRAERKGGKEGVASARVIAAWIAFLQSAQKAGNKINDAGVTHIDRALLFTGRERTKSLVGLLDATLAEDEALLELIERLIPSHMPEISTR